MPTYPVLEQPGTQKLLAARALYLLKKSAFFLKAAVTDADLNSSFAYNSDVTVARPKLTGDAEDYNPRSGVSALSREVDYVRTTLRLEKLYTEGMPVYATDPSQERYVRDFSEVAANAIRRAAERYFYETCFRAYLIPPTGVYRYGANAPVQVAWSETALGVLAPFGRNLLVRSAGILQGQEVPSSDLYAAVSPEAIGDMLQAAPTEEGMPGAWAKGGDILTNGLPEGSFIARHGLRLGSSTSTTGQIGVANLSGGTSSVTIASATQDNFNFLKDEQVTATPLGAVAITVSAAFASPVGAGQIVRIGNLGAPAIAYGVIIRTSGTTGVTVVPYGSRGEVVSAARITAAIAGGVRLSVPDILNVAPAYHKEHILFATRKLIEPGQGEGAVCETVADPMSGLVMQVMRGSYKVDNYSASARASVLMGVTPTDHQKAVLMLCG